MKKKILSLSLVFCMLVSLLTGFSVTVAAAAGTVYPYYIITMGKTTATGYYYVYKQSDSAGGFAAFTNSADAEANTAYSSISAAISAISSEVANGSVTLHFGLTGSNINNITGTLNLGSNTIDLISGQGTYTLKGNMSGNQLNANSAMINLNGPSIIIDGANLQNSNNCIFNSGNGSITVNSGVVYGDEYAIVSKTGTVNVNGGTIYGNTPITAGNVNIEGGVIEAFNGPCISLSGGISHINGGYIESSNSSATFNEKPGTVFMTDNGQNSVKLYINGGTVKNNANMGYAVYNNNLDEAYSSEVHLSGSPQISGSTGIWTNTAIYADNGTGTPFSTDGILSIEYGGSINAGSTVAVGNVTAGVNDSLFAITNNGYKLELNNGELILNTYADNNDTLVSVANQRDANPGSQSGTDTSNAITWSINVPNSVSMLYISDIAVKLNTIKQLYSDSNFSFTENRIPLTSGETKTVYIKTSAQGGTDKYYAVSITKAAAGNYTLTASQDTVSRGQSVIFTTDAPPDNMAAFFLDGVHWGNGSIGTTPNPFPWEVIGNGRTKDVLATYRIYDFSAYGGSNITYDTPYLGEVQVIFRLDPETIPAGLVSVAGFTDYTPGTQSGADANNAITWSLNVPNSTSVLGPTDLTGVTNATVNLYSDSAFTNEITGDNTLALAAGTSTKAYIKVTAMDSTVKYYAVTINRAAATLTDMDIVESAKALLTTEALNPVKGIDTNIITKAQTVVGAVYSGVTVTLDLSANAQISAPGGAITYGSTVATGNVTFRLTKNTASETQDVSITVPADSNTSAADIQAVSGAKVLLAAASLNPIKGVDTNIITKAQTVVGAVYSGVTVTLDSSANTQIIAPGGAITYGGMAATGNLIFRLTKNAANDTQTVSITVPADANMSATDIQAVAGAKVLLAAAALNPVNGIDTNILTKAQTVVNAVYSGVTVTLDSSANAQISAPGGAITYGSTAVTGNVTFRLTKNAATDTQTVTITVPMYVSSNQNNSGNSGNTSTQTPNNQINVVVNGQQQQGIATATDSKENGKTVTTVAIDQQKLEQKLEREGLNAVISIPMNSSTGTVVTELNGQTVKSMEAKQAILKVETAAAGYTLPANQIDIDAVSNKIGKQVELKDIKVKIEISKSADEMIKVVEDSAQKGSLSIVVPPVEFNIKCSYGDKTVDVSSFNSYVERTIAIPDGVDPNKITTGIVVDPDGTVRHVPTKVVVIDGKYYAKINSITNSTYTVIWHPLEFADVNNHWAKEAVNDMGSRLVVTGVGNGMYEPDRDITRAEFAAIVVKAMGLKPGTGDNPFKDVSSSDWYNAYIKTAYAYKIILGYTKNDFAPNEKITREEAMAMIARAMNIIGLKADISNSESEKLLAGFSDSAKASAYAKNNIASCIKTGVVTGKENNLLAPDENVTRAEVAAMVQRLLKKSGLI